jgi:hypothetical protein
VKKTGFITLILLGVLLTPAIQAGQAVTVDTANAPLQNGIPSAVIASEGTAVVATSTTSSSPVPLLALFGLASLFVVFWFRLFGKHGLAV